MRIDFGDYYLPKREEVHEQLYARKASVRTRVKADRREYLASLWPAIPTDWDKVSIVILFFDLLLSFPM